MVGLDFAALDDFRNRGYVCLAETCSKLLLTLACPNRLDGRFEFLRLRIPACLAQLGGVVIHEVSITDVPTLSTGLKIQAFLQRERQRSK